MMKGGELRSVFHSASGKDWYAPVLLGPSTIASRALDPETLTAVRAVLDRLTPDEYTTYLKEYYDEGRRRFGSHWKMLEIMNVLYAAATLLQPRRYLEIGVRRGRSMGMVLAASPATRVVGFDLWVTGYAGMENPGVEFVRKEMARLAPGAEVELVSGDSHVTVPAHLAAHPEEQFDLVTVDGDHSREGALNDLRNVLPALADGGVLVFDDIAHPSHPELLEVWRQVVREDGGLESYEFTELGYGVAFAVRQRPRRSGGTRRASLLRRGRQLVTGVLSRL
jgi:predicted O-methyltransferase YrrM